MTASLRQPCLTPVSPRQCPQAALPPALSGCALGGDAHTGPYAVAAADRGPLGSGVAVSPPVSGDGRASEPAAERGGAGPGAAPGDAQRLTAAVLAWWSQQRQAWCFPLKTWRLALSSPDLAADRGCAWLPPQGWCWVLGAAWLCAVLASLRPTSPSSSPSSYHPCFSLSCVRRDARGGRAVVSLSAVRGLLAFAGGGERGLPSGRDDIPEDLRDPFYVDQYEQEHIKPPVIKLLLSSELYCRVCSLILRGDQVAALQGHQSVVQALSRRGIYVMEGDDTPVTEPELSRAPIKMSAHMAMVDALMMAYTVEMISIEKVVASVKRFSTFSASKELPYDLEDAMVFWVNKGVCRVFIGASRVLVACLPGTWWPAQQQRCGFSLHVVSPPCGHRFLTCCCDRCPHCSAWSQNCCAFNEVWALGRFDIGGRVSRLAPRAGALIPVGISGSTGQACQVACEFLLLCGIVLGTVLPQAGRLLTGLLHARHLRRSETPPPGAGPAPLLPLRRVGSAPLQCAPGPAQEGRG
ncbi:hypothetical protein J1605_017258 [Eschrichtius robustus]|uniref:CASAMP N-terminal domain-containing protein n=1 Tax=Eschrichtius robustus TaxID=9764 RepID=A0AB34I372_ESCRO|nr:hypothetical protein J1605_017258 [Eschrichtius robustus]